MHVPQAVNTEYLSSQNTATRGLTSLSSLSVLGLQVSVLSAQTTFLPVSTTFASMLSSQIRFVQNASGVSLAYQSGASIFYFSSALSSAVS